MELFLVLGIIYFLISILIAWGTFEDIKNPLKHKRISKIFSVYTNGKELFQSDENISCINGIIVLSYIMMCYMHSMQVLVNISGLAGMYAEFKTRSFLVTGFLSIDTFLLLCGFMFGVNFSQKDNSSWRVIFRQYMTYTPTFGFFILILVSMTNFSGLDSFYPEETQRCKQFWWSIVLYVQNYVNPIYRCLSATWIFTVAFHIILIAPILRLIFKCSSRLTRISLMSLILVSTYVPRTLAIWLSKSVDVYYSETLSRSFPLLFGLFYYFEFFKIKNISTIRRTILWILAALILSSQLVFLYYKSVSVEQLMNFFWIVRTLHPFALCWLIHACHYGWGGIINRILSHRFFIPLSNISIGVVLINDHVAHYIILDFTHFTSGYGIETKIVLIFISTLIISIISSIFLHLFIGAPFSKLSNLLMNNFKHSSSSRSGIESLTGIRDGKSYENFE